jgi:chaperonin GroEL
VDKALVDWARRGTTNVKWAAVTCFEPATGFNVLTGAYEDMFAAGVIDPVKVTRSGPQNAGSIAGMLMTTETIITDLPEKESAPAMPPGGGMGGMDY